MSNSGSKARRGDAASIAARMAIAMTWGSKTGVLAAYAVVGEREQGTLEPVRITPIRREEFLVGKALAVLVPTLVIAYLVFGIFLGVPALFAQQLGVLASRPPVGIVALMSFNVIVPTFGLALGLAAALADLLESAGDCRRWRSPPARC